ncbi:MAG TPA: hypothetical protein VLG47_06550 [Candidatus Saccharimonadales bacterium]|nr:hypothetical protein [Candidatus Saccharimonadales bacterium]
MAEVSTINRGLGEWVHGLRQEGLSKAAALLDENKAETTRALIEMGLPHFRSVSCSTAEFLHDPDTYLEGLTTPTFYASINSSDPNRHRLRQFGMDRAGTVEFVDTVVRDHGTQYESLLLMETGPILYGANIVISRNYPSDIFPKSYKEPTQSLSVASNRR